MENTEVIGLILAVLSVLIVVVDIHASAKLKSYLTPDQRTRYDEETEED